MSQVRMAKALGAMGIGLGLGEVLAPRWLAGQIGLGDDRTAVLRTMGARELGIGVMVLAEDKPTKGMWGRVAGDAVDIALLSAALLSPRTSRGRAFLALGTVLGATLLDTACTLRLQRPTPPAQAA